MKIAFIIRKENEDKPYDERSGAAVLFGGGFGFPVGEGGTRILLNINYALRPGIDVDDDVNNKKMKGSVRVFSITVGGLF